MNQVQFDHRPQISRKRERFVDDDQQIDSRVARRPFSHARANEQTSIRLSLTAFIVNNSRPASSSNNSCTASPQYPRSVKHKTAFGGPTQCGRGISVIDVR